MQAARTRSNVPDNVMDAMRTTNQLFNTEVVAKRNFEALDQIYTSDARVLPPGPPMIEGRDNIKDFWKQAIAAMGVTAAELHTVRAERAGDDVLEIGQAELTLAAGQIVRAKYVVHWKQENGAWKWNVDIWNLNE